MYPLGGYQGRYIFVDLSTGKVEKRELPVLWAKDFLGGDGFAVRVLWDDIKPGIDPFSPENVLVLAIGPITGTLFPPSGRYMVASLSPQTLHWGEAHAGGFFGPELKYAGYDLLVITGKADYPVYLLIEDDRVEIRDARHLWGKTTFEVTALLEEEHHDPDLRVLTIGPAGERLVRFSAVISDYFRAAGRTGLGAVLGSKNLKAIAVRGSQPVRVKHPQEFMDFSTYMFREHKFGEWANYIKHTSRRYGTTGLMDAMNAIGRLPVKNHYDGFYPEIEKVGGEAIRKGYRVAHKSCFGCGIQCKYFSLIKEGPYSGTRSEGPEYETVDAWAPNILVSDLDIPVRANYLANAYGVDTISAGSMVAFVMELFEKGILTREDTDGLEIRWGDGETALKLLEMIVRREGIGDVLAEGVYLASMKIGKGAERYAIEVNGLDASAQDPRAHKSVGLTYAINVRGADHLRSLSIIDELGFRKKSVERFPHLDPDICGDLLDETYKGYMVADQEETFAICDSLILCKYGVMWPPIHYFPEFAKAIAYSTGLEEYLEVEEVRKLARRIVHLRRAFNMRLGLSKDILHPRFTEEPMPGGPAKGQVCKLEPMLKEYYEARKYDPETGFFYYETLVDAGLEDVARELETYGRIVRRGDGGS